MKHIIVAAIMSASCLTGFSAVAATALSAAAPATSPIVLVDGGCGPGGFRDRNGYCRPKTYAYPRRYCGPGFHPTPYGCRPNF